MKLIDLFGNTVSLTDLEINSGHKGMLQGSSLEKIANPKDPSMIVPAHQYWNHLLVKSMENVGKPIGDYFLYTNAVAAIVDLKIGERSLETFMMFERSVELAVEEAFIDDLPVDKAVTGALKAISKLK